VPSDLAVTYYSQRADAGLIITEATSVSPMGVGYARTPGIWSDEQTEGWKPIVEAVHAKGGRIFLQLWHVGRISHPMFLNGALPEAPSAVKPKGHVSLVRPQVEYVTPRPLESEEIKAIIAAYAKGAANAKRAGFDGVEIHGANGYLLDQFLQDSTNRRSDAYGGPVQNRARLMLEVADIYRQRGQNERCLTALYHLLDTYPPGNQPQSVLVMQGLTLMDLGRPQQATDVFLAAREHGPPSADLYFYLARSYSAAGQVSDATAAAQQALAINASHEPSRQLLAQLATRTSSPDASQRR